MIKPINQKNFITETKLIQIKYIQNLNISRYAVVFNICQTIHINICLKHIFEIKTLTNVVIDMKYYSCLIIK